MNTLMMTVMSILALAALFVLLPVVTDTFIRNRNRRSVTCPETKGSAEVDIDAKRAALSSAIGRPLLRVKNCTLWPMRRDCDQECLRP
jgi:hypothetical protein